MIERWYTGSSAGSPPTFAVRSRKGARQRRIEYRLKFEDVVLIVHRARGRCEVTGIPFNDEKPEGQRIRPYAPSLDRIDSRGGYL